MRRSEWLYLGYVLVGLFFLVWAGVNNLWTYIPYWFVAGPYLLAAVYASRRCRPRLALGSFLAAVALVLVMPHVRLSFLGGFYMDCWRIQESRPLSEARHIMAPYVEVRTGREVWGDAPAQFWNAQLLGEPETSLEHENRVIFIPSRRYSADWCICYQQGGQVTRVEISPD